MPTNPATDDTLRAENAKLRARLEEAEETLRAIRAGEVDAFVVEGDAGPQLFTLQGLDAEQNRFRGEMLAQVSDAVIAVDTEERITFLNASAERQYAVRAGDMLGRKLTEIYTRVWPSPEAEGAMWTALRERGEWRGELIQRMPDGRELHVETARTALRGPDGATTGYVAAIRDITERKRAEEALREKEHFLQRITQVTPGLLYVFDLVGRRTVFINRTVASVLGVSPEEVAAMSAEVVPTLMHPEDLPRFDSHIARVRALADGEVADFEYRMRDRAGAWHWFHSHDAVFARDATGAARQLIGVATEITERKRAEQMLADRTELLNGVLESTTDVIFAKDLNGRTLMVNAAFAAAARSTPEQLVGKTDEDWFPPDVAAAVRQQDEAVIAGGSPMQFEDTVPVAGEARVFLTLKAPLRDGSSRIVGILGIGRDITARKEAEAALRANEERMHLATAATGVGIWEWNVLTGLIRWDAQMFQLYGVAPTADGFVSYDTWSRAVMPEDLPRQEEVLMDTVRRVHKSTREFRILRADDGECRWIASVETVRANEQGKAEWVIGTNLDLTERKNAERTIREEAQRKDEFLAMLGHELRNPLNAIRHAVQISAETPDDDEACQWSAKVIDRQSQQLARMVDDLLDVARINRGRIELRVETLDVATVLERAVAVVRPLFEQRRHALSTQFAGPLRVTGDAARLEQVFVNLLNNAAKYTPEGGSISVRAHHEDGEAVVTITDNGVGISAELLPHVFDLFRQADSTLDRAMGGLGIGLNVVKSLVEMHLGGVVVESAGANAGTTVSVRLPLLLEMPPPPAAAPAPAAPATVQKSTRVLVVDDHEDAAHALARLLKRRGCEVRCAHTGPDGVTAAREFLPAALLLDLGLPGFDGYEVARILRAEAPLADAVFIAISGYAQDGDRQRCLASGFDEHFAKPVDFPKLVEAIHTRCLA